MEDPSPDELARTGPPHGVALHAYATVSAELAEGDRPASEVLAAHSLTIEQWVAVTSFWAQRMGDDARASAEAGGPPRVTLAFSDAFARAQDAQRPLVELAPAEWAALVLDAEAFGLRRALARRALRQADHARLVRHWAVRLATDHAARRAYDDARTGMGKHAEGV